MKEIYDIEVLSNFFSYTGLDPNNQKISQFVIHKSRNDLVPFISHLKKLKGMIGYNNCGYDYQVIQWILNEYRIHGFEDLNGEEISDLIYQRSQKVIQKSNNTIFNDIPEWNFDVPQMDLYLLWGFNQQAKRTSLKWVEYMLDMDIEEMPIKHYDQVHDNQIKIILDYNLHDVKCTYELYKITKGDTDHPLYKGIDKVKLRDDIQKEFGIKCINYNDVRIGDALNKSNYLKIKRIDKNEIPKPKNVTKELTFGDCFPEYTKFESIEFNNFISIIKNIKIKIK